MFGLGPVIQMDFRHPSKKERKLSQRLRRVQYSSLSEAFATQEKKKEKVTQTNKQTNIKLGPLRCSRTTID